MKILELIEKTVKESSKDSAFQAVRDALFKHGIKINFDPIGSSKSRMILHSSRYNVKNWEIAREANGLVIDYRTWRVLCRVPELPILAFKRDEVAKHIAAGLYDIYEAEDGTVVNLYQADGQWYVSTGRGFDMGGVSWGGIRYWDALHEAGLDEKKLDTSVTYTLGLTHPKMHPMHTTPRLWYISSIGADGIRHWDLPPTGIPAQRRTEVKSIEDVDDVLKRDTGFGLVFRSRNPAVTGIHSTLLMESTLMQTIRRLMYDRELTTDAITMDLDRCDYVITIAALQKSENFVKLFPQYADKFRAVTAAMNATAGNILRGGSLTTADQLWRSELQKQASLSTMYTTKEHILEIIGRRQYASMWCRQVFKK